MKVEIKNMRIMTLVNETHDSYPASFPYKYKFIKNQTEQKSLIAVKRFGCRLQDVKNQTEAICLVAVKSVGWAL
jgi:hypothetical protein